MEQVYRNSSKVLVDVQNGNNIMYLPLDKMINNGGDTKAPAVNPLAPNSRANSSDGRTPDLRPETSRADSTRTGRG
jgi:membrane protease subunit HflK